jgi:hypothetical protein
MVGSVSTASPVDASKATLGVGFGSASAEQRRVDADR